VYDDNPFFVSSLIEEGVQPESRTTINKKEKIYFIQIKIFYSTGLFANKHNLCCGLAYPD